MTCMKSYEAAYALGLAKLICENDKVFQSHQD
jgi:hypothetical protein